jgi:hypothetical protein
MRRGVVAIVVTQARPSNAAGKRLTAGRYKLKLTVTGRAPQTLSFSVR